MTAVGRRNALRDVSTASATNPPCHCAFPQTRVRVCDAIPFHAPDRFLLKSYVDEAHAMYSGHSDNNVPDAAMYELLDPVQELLSNHYAAVGILERYNSTLHLFNVALEMPGVDWPSAFDEYGVVNKDKLFHNDIEQAIDKVMTDATIKRYLHLDLLLYEHAVAVHTRQLEEYGLV